MCRTVPPTFFYLVSDSFSQVCPLWGAPRKAGSKTVQDCYETKEGRQECRVELKNGEYNGCQQECLEELYLVVVVTTLTRRL